MKTRIKLARNLSIKYDLCNGIMGKVGSVTYTDGQYPPALPSTVLVIFGDLKGPTFGIERHSPVTPVASSFLKL